MKKIALGGIFFWCLYGLLASIYAQDIITVDGTTGYDGTADSFNSSTWVLIANESDAFDGYTEGDIVEFISGTANHQVAIIDVWTSCSQVTLDRDIGSVTDGDQFNCVAGTWSKLEKFRYINSALKMAWENSVGYVRVDAGSYGPLHNGETLPVKIECPSSITEFPLTLASASGAGSTIIESDGATRYTCIEILTDNITVEGFTCLGSQGSGLAGIYLNQVTDCLVNSNICGPSSSGGNANTDGILIGGSGGSVGNTITGNTCRYNSGNGVTLQYAQDNVITLNTVTHNGVNGISVELGSEHNTVSENTASSNTGAGIKIAGASGSPAQYNSIVRNTSLSGNKHGFEVNAEALYNRIYLNSFGGTVPVYCVQPITPTNIYHSPTPLHYVYNGTQDKTYLGNYYSDDDHNNDPDGNGISADSYTIVNRTFGGSNNSDDYQLVDLPDSYGLNVWWFFWSFGDTDMISDTITRNSGSDIVSASGVLELWSAGDPANRDRRFPEEGTGTWTGQIYFTTAPANGDTFDIQLSSSDPDAEPSSPAQITGDGSSHSFTFETSSFALDVPEYEYLVVYITNNSTTTDYDLLTGGAFGYVSSPEGSPPLLVDLVDFRGYGLPDKVLLLWRTAAEIDNAGFEIRRRVSGGDWLTVTPALIPGEGGATWGARYAYTDTTVEPNATYEYQLLDYDFNGTVTAHPPVTVTLTEHLPRLN